MSSHRGGRSRTTIRSAIRRLKYAELPPNAVFYFPIALGAILAVLVALGITGSSSTLLHDLYVGGADPRLIWGTPRSVRSDEWLVQVNWLVSQVHQGLPVTNETFPGGMDSTVQNALPSWDWSTAFRPHLLGFWVLPLDQAAALRWWLPAFAMMAGCYAFIVTYLPRRFVFAAIFSVAFFFSPFLQWWFLSITFWPLAWAFVVLTAARLITRPARPSTRIAWAAISGYLTVTMVMEIYLPFVIPMILLVTIVTVLTLVTPAEHAPRFRERFQRALPLLTAAVSAGIVCAVWALTRWDTIQGVLDTVYPGLRAQATGEGGKSAALDGWTAPFSDSLLSADGVNSSELSTFVVVGLVLLIPTTWSIITAIRRRTWPNPLSIGAVSFAIIIAAFYWLPGWDPVAHLIGLDRVKVERMRIGVGLLTVVAVVTCLQEYATRAIPKAVKIITLVVLVTCMGLTTRNIMLRPELPLHNSHAWIALSLLLLLSVVLFLYRRPTLAAVAMLAVTATIGSGVNPLYIGVFDISSTPTGRTISSIDRDDPGPWVVVGGVTSVSAVVQSGVEAYNGVQTAPSLEMWHEIDPDNKYEPEWNRLAHVLWQPGTGAPQVSNPQPDIIVSTFDSCATFAQTYVDHVLSEYDLGAQACLRPVSEVDVPAGHLWFYDVVANPTN